MAHGQPAAGQDEAGVALGDGHRHARGHHRPAPAGGQQRRPPGPPGRRRRRRRGRRRAAAGRGRGGPAGSRSSGGQPTIASMLAWIDLEMTGLDPSTEVIVEIAVLLTDDDLEIVAEGPDVVVSQPAEKMAAMADVVRRMHDVERAHGGGGGVDHVAGGRRPARCSTSSASTSPSRGRCPLCGNSIGTDRRFLAAYLPELDTLLPLPVDRRVDGEGAVPAVVPGGLRGGAGQGRRPPGPRRHPGERQGAALLPGDDLRRPSPVADPTPTPSRRREPLGLPRPPGAAGLRPPGRRGRVPREHHARLRARRRPGVPVPGDRRPDHGRRGAASPSTTRSSTGSPTCTGRVVRAALVGGVARPGSTASPSPCWRTSSPPGPTPG